MHDYISVWGKAGKATGSTGLISSLNQTGEFNHLQNNLYRFNLLAEDDSNLYVLGQMLQKGQMCTNQNIIKLLVLNLTIKCCNG